MSYIISRKTGYISDGSTWAWAATGTNVQQVAGTSIFVVTTSETSLSPTFAVSGAEVDAVLLNLSHAALSAGRLQVNLYNQTTSTNNTVIVDLSAINSSGKLKAQHDPGWVCFKLPSPINMVFNNTYTIKLSASVANQVKVFYTGSTSFNHLLRTTSTIANPVSSDQMLVVGDYTSGNNYDYHNIYVNVSSSSLSSLYPTINVYGKNSMVFPTSGGVFLRTAATSRFYCDSFLSIGTSAAPVTGECTWEAVNYGNSSTEAGVSIYSPATVSIYGVPKRSFTLLLDSVSAGDTQLHVAHPVDWNVGDRLVLPSTGAQGSEGNEEVTLLSVSGTSLSTTPLAFPHLGGWRNNLDVRCEVANSTRNIKIGNYAPAGSFFLHFYANAYIRNCEFYGYGTSSSEGIGLAIWTLPSSAYAVVENCAVRDSISTSVGACNIGSINAAAGNIKFVDNVLNGVGKNNSSFWSLYLSFPNNVQQFDLRTNFTSNLVITGTNIIGGGYGALFLYPVDLTFSDNRIAGSYSSYGIQHNGQIGLITEWDRNVIHSCKIAYAIVAANNSRVFDNNFTFRDWLIWNNSQTGFIIQGPFLTTFTGLTAFGHTTQTILTQCDCRIYNSVLEGGVNYVTGSHLGGVGSTSYTPGVIKIANSTLSRYTDSANGDIFFTSVPDQRYSLFLQMWNTSCMNTTLTKRLSVSDNWLPTSQVGGESIMLDEPGNPIGDKFWKPTGYLKRLTNGGYLTNGSCLLFKSWDPYPQGITFSPWITRHVLTPVPIDAGSTRTISFYVSAGDAYSSHGNNRINVYVQGEKVLISDISGTLRAQPGYNWFTVTIPVSVIPYTGAAEFEIEQWSDTGNEIQTVWDKLRWS